MRIALYARVSTLDQHPEIQVHALEQYATARGLEVVETYVDRGQSGAKASRPALDRLLEDAQKQKLIVIHKDARSGTYVIDEVLYEAS